MNLKEVELEVWKGGVLGWLYRISGLSWSFGVKKPHQPRPERKKDRELEKGFRFGKQGNLRVEVERSLPTTCPEL